MEKLEISSEMFLQFSKLKMKNWKNPKLFYIRSILPHFCLQIALTIRTMKACL